MEPPERVIQRHRLMFTVNAAAVLLPINKSLGPERVIFLYSAIAIA